MMLFGLLFTSTALTAAMFGSRNVMLGFPCAIFWMITGGYAYTQSAALWDIYYFIFFACALGMTTFSALAAYGLREKKDTETDKDEYVDEEGGLEEESYYGERKSDSGDGAKKDTEPAMTRSEQIRARARKRRGRTSGWGEFK